MRKLRALLALRVALGASIQEIGKSVAWEIPQEN